MSKVRWDVPPFLARSLALNIQGDYCDLNKNLESRLIWVSITFEMGVFRPDRKPQSISAVSGGVRGVRGDGTYVCGQFEEL